MNKITEKQILEVAKLAKLSIDPSDLPIRVAEFNEILTHIEKLNEIAVSNSTTDRKIELEMFEDAVQPSLPIDQVLLNSPSSEKPFFYIPRVIEGGKS